MKAEEDEQGGDAIQDYNGGENPEDDRDNQDEQNERDHYPDQDNNADQDNDPNQDNDPGQDNDNEDGPVDQVLTTLSSAVHASSNVGLLNHAENANAENAIATTGEAAEYVRDDAQAVENGGAGPSYPRSVVVSDFASYAKRAGDSALVKQYEADFVPKNDSVPKDVVSLGVDAFSVKNGSVDSQDWSLSAKNESLSAKNGSTGAKNESVGTEYRLSSAGNHSTLAVNQSVSALGRLISAMNESVGTEREPVGTSTQATKFDDGNVVSSDVHYSENFPPKDDRDRSKMYEDATEGPYKGGDYGPQTDTKDPVLKPTEIGDKEQYLEIEEPKGADVKKVEDLVEKYRNDRIRDNKNQVDFVDKPALKYEDEVQLHDASS